MDTRLFSVSARPIVCTGARRRSVAVALVEREVRVAEDDRVGAGELGAQALETTSLRARVVDDPDPCALGLEDDAIGQLGADLGNVDVAVHGNERGADRRDLGKRLGAGEVARVDDRVGAREVVDARLRKAARPARHVGVGNERDPHALEVDDAENQQQEERADQ
jgi:hypothetical protein